jgi:hypothetical protein
MVIGVLTDRHIIGLGYMFCSGRQAEKPGINRENTVYGHPRFVKRGNLDTYIAFIVPLSKFQLV